MNNSINIIKDKLKEKNIEIYKEALCGDEYNIICGEMMLFIKENEISVAFQATVRPEDAASYVLLLTETNLKLTIMESFILDSDFNVITGDDAHKLIKNCEYDLIVKEIAKENVLNEILLKTDGFKC